MWNELLLRVARREPAVVNDQIGPGVVPLLLLATTCR
jgi:hypothetical protein